VALIVSLFLFKVVRLPEPADEEGPNAVVNLPGPVSLHGAAVDPEGSGATDAAVDAPHSSAQRVVEKPALQLTSPATDPLSPTDLEGGGLLEELVAKDAQGEMVVPYYRYGPKKASFVMICAHGAQTSTYQEWMEVAKHVNQAHPEWKLLVIHLSWASGRGAMTDAISALVEESVRSEARAVVLAGKSAGGAGVLKYLLKDQMERMKSESDLQAVVRGVLLAAPAMALSVEDTKVAIHSSIRPNTLVLWSEGDDSIPVANAERYREMGVEVKTYPGGGHYVPKESLDDIQAFLEGVADRSAR